MHVDPAGTSGSDLAAVTGADPVTEMSPPPSTYLSGTLDGISSSLSMSTDALRSSLGSGSSLAQIAAQQGVSRSDLLKTVETEMQQRRVDRGVAPIDQSALVRIANRAIDRGRGDAAAAQGVDPLDGPTQPGTASGDGVDTLA